MRRKHDTLYKLTKPLPWLEKKQKKYEGDFEAILGPLWAYFLHWRVTLVAPWRHFGVNVGIRGSIWGHSGVTLVPLWRHFGATLGPLWVYGGDFGSLWDHYVMIVEALWVYEGPFSKNTHFPNRF